MAVKTSVAPGVFISEIDRSGYTQTPSGTAVYLKGFTDKGEAYRPIEITTRSAYEQIYGAPDTEAERYTYAAACETLNQNGRLWMARLPYDNESFEKLVGVKYEVKFNQIEKTSELCGGNLSAIHDADEQIEYAAKIIGGKTPLLYDLSAIDEYRTDESKVPANTFLIVDTTGATYKRVPEDIRKGKDREVIGIVPIVTTAANALYMQNMISLDNYGKIKYYEPICGSTLQTLSAVDAEGKTIVIDQQEMWNDGLRELSDTVKRFSTESYYSLCSSITQSVLSVCSVASSDNGITAFQDESAALSILDEYNLSVDAEKAWQLSSSVVQYTLSGQKLEQKIVWHLRFSKDEDALSGKPDELCTMVQNTVNDLCAKQDGSTSVDGFYFTCEDDARRLGLMAFDGWKKKDANKDVAQYINAVVEPYETSDWVDFTNGYETAEKRDEALEKFKDLTSYRDCGAIVDNNAGKLVYYVVDARILSVTQELLSTDSRYGWHGVDFDDDVPDTLALDAVNYFPTIQPATDGEGFDPEHLKDIGVVVYKAYLDPAEGNKVSFEAVEAYAGSLYKDDKDPNTGVTKFIDTIINSQSNYINFFSNCFSSTTAKKFYKETCDIIIAEPSQGACLGLYSPMTKKDISISKSILDGMNKCFEKVEDVVKLDIDIVPDAGLANIASYIKAIFGDKGPYDLSITDDLGNSMLGMWTCKKATDAHVKMWKTIEMKHDNFCKNVRKDCMFIADGLRPLVIQGQKKTIRDTKPTNSIDKDILPYVPAICGLNTSYGAGYIDWFEQADDYTGDFFWCPPSIKAMGVYINTDVNFEYWDAPAGLTRGVVAATDVAFSPNTKQSSSIYEKNWNYAINYPQDGIVLEGQKTFQTKPTALDRVNVRRTMLRLERAAFKTLRYFVYEGNTAYLRQRVVDALEPIMKACWKSGNGGIQRYKIICDETNNTADTIDNNELHVTIGIVPTKTTEQIFCSFVLGSQGSTWDELLG